MTAATDFVITSFDGRSVIFLPSRQLSLCGEPLSLVHYTGRSNSDWWAETLREPTTATLACDQRRCRHTLARVKVIDLNVWVSSRPPLWPPSVCEANCHPKPLPASVAASACGGHAAGVVVAATAISAADIRELRAGYLFKKASVRAGPSSLFAAEVGALAHRRGRRRTGIGYMRSTESEREDAERETHDYNSTFGGTQCRTIVSGCHDVLGRSHCGSPMVAVLSSFYRALHRHP